MERRALKVPIAQASNSIAAEVFAKGTCLIATEARKPSAAIGIIEIKPFFRASFNATEVAVRIALIACWERPGTTSRNRPISPPGAYLAIMGINSWGSPAATSGASLGSSTPGKTLLITVETTVRQKIPPMLRPKKAKDVTGPRSSLSTEF